MDESIDLSTKWGVRFGSLAEYCPRLDMLEREAIDECPCLRALPAPWRTQ